jgi:sugar phosphate isomerase/epimerase
MTEGRIAISEVTTAEWSFEEDVRAYSEAPGVDGIGVWREKLAASEYSPAAARERLDRAGLEACSLLFAGGFTEDFEAGLADAREAIRTAERLGAPVLLVVAGPRIGVSPAEGGRLAQEALAELAPDAREAGVTLALEPIHPIKIAEYSTVVTLAEARDAVAGIDGTGLLLDIWNSWWEPDLVAELPEVADEVAGVQISDFRAGDDPMDRAPPGEGIAPLGEIVGALERSGYEGWYEVELFTERYDPSAYPDLIETCVSGTARLLSEGDTR